MLDVTKEVKTTSESHPRLCCLKCSSVLNMALESVVCSKCGSSWPVKNGIPRFFQTPKYWGEIGQEEAAALLREARQKGWRRAVARWFEAGRQDMVISLLDWQRTSWFSLLGLKRDAVALDLGSGYGAITQSLASALPQVYSLEAIPERIEFTRTRLQQEQISNVYLVQASALEPPFHDQSFDLIVVNGVLEWVGEWATDGNPRSVQIRFLSNLRRLLKDDGMLVIGIENRIGYGLLRGDLDHSDLPYTSLMPRFLASLVLRYSHRPHRQTLLNPNREYRTYTYSERGYRKLLADSGFTNAHFWWAYPGYNQPYSLTPLRSPHVREQFRSNLRRALRPSPVAWRRWVTSILGRLGFPRAIVTDFVILAGKGRDPGAHTGERLWRCLRTALAQIPELTEPIFGLTTQPFGNKNVVCVFESKETVPRFILKSSTPAPGSNEAVESEFRNLELVTAHLRKRAKPAFAVPEPIGSLSVGSLLYTVESVADGQELLQVLLPQAVRPQFSQMSREVARCIDAAIQLAEMLRGEQKIRLVDPSWWELPPELQSDGGVQRLVQQVRMTPFLGEGKDGEWVQHGDFTVENVFWDRLSGKLSVVDWESSMRGVPPLYDIFSFLVSALPAVEVEDRVSVPHDHCLDAQFMVAFFSNGKSAALNRQFLLRACERLGIPSNRVWEMFVQFLVLRLRYFLSMDSRQQPQYYLSFLRLTSRHADEFLLASGIV